VQLAHLFRSGSLGEYVLSPQAAPAYIQFGGRYCARSGDLSGVSVSAKPVEPSVKIDTTSLNEAVVRRVLGLIDSPQGAASRCHRCVRVTSIVGS